MSRVIAFMSDLFFQARIGETARQIGVEFKVASAIEPFLAACGDANAPVSLIIIDLNAGSAPSFGPSPAANAAVQRATGNEALERLRAAGNQTPVVAFLSHVQTDLAAKARATIGANGQVMPRSQFTQDLAVILGRAKYAPAKAV